MRRPVRLQNTHGDEMDAIYHFNPISDMPGTIDANGTHQSDIRWAELGWHVITWGDWEL